MLLHLHRSAETEQKTKINHHIFVLRSAATDNMKENCISRTSKVKAMGTLTTSYM